MTPLYDFSFAWCRTTVHMVNPVSKTSAVFKAVVISHFLWFVEIPLIHIIGCEVTMFMT